MCKISLINMPFGNTYTPSIALTQIRSAIRMQLGEACEVELLYLNHDFSLYLGEEFYDDIVQSIEHHSCGTGEWFFRQAAFPDLHDNSEEYFGRYFPFPTDEVREFQRKVMLKRRGLDEFMNGLLEKHRLHESDIVGFTSMFSQNAASIAMARKIKEKNPESVIVMGGANCEFPMGEVLEKNIPHIDAVFSGPALVSFPRFVRNCMDGEREKNDQINGVFTAGNRDRRGGKDLAFIGEELALDESVELDYDSYLDSVEGKFEDTRNKVVLFFETSRGCWWGARSHCTFCGLNGATMEYRSMRSEKALAMIRSMFRYADRCREFHSVDNIIPVEYLTEVVPRIAPPEDVNLFYETKSSLTEDNVKGLSRAHIRTIQPGIESLNTSTLKLMGKGSTVFQNLQLLKHCALYGVDPQWNLLVGFPGEKDDVYRKYVRDIPLLVHLPPPGGVFPVRFDRYSPYFKHRDRYGLDLQPFDYYELTFPFSADDIEQMAYYFMDNNIDSEYFMMMTEWIDRIRGKWKLWFESWHGRRRELYFSADEPTVVVDTRGGDNVRHDVGEAGLEILNLLRKPFRETDVETRLTHLPDVREKLSDLREKGLVFEEKERYLSLVMPRKTEDVGEQPGLSLQRRETMSV